MKSVFKDLNDCRSERVSAGKKWVLVRRILSHNDVRWLSQVLCQENTLQSLDLNGCEIGDEGKLINGYFALALEVSLTDIHCVSNVSTSDTIIVICVLHSGCSEKLFRLPI